MKQKFKQLVFIDDSGDPGFKIQKGSSPVFIIALVIFEDQLVAEEVSLSIKKLKRDLKFPDEMEFKFHKSSSKTKVKFLQTISTFDFKIRSIVVKKDRIYSNFLRISKESFFNYIVMQVLKHSKGYINQAKLKFDKRGEKRIRNELRVYLSQELNNRENHIFSDLKFVDSKQNVLIQLADMVAGCIAAKHKNTNTSWHNIIKNRIEDEWVFK